jgi:hypothetical protein
MRTPDKDKILMELIDMQFCSLGFTGGLSRIEEKVKGFAEALTGIPVGLKTALG